MTYNVIMHGNYNLVMDHIKRYEKRPLVASYEDFNGQTMHGVVTALGFYTEEDRLVFLLTMQDKLYMCESTDKETIIWGHQEF